MQYKSRKVGIAVTVVLLVGALLAVYRMYIIHKIISKDPPVFVCNSSHSPEIDSWDGFNTLVVYTGRWKFLRILFPYVYRELRQNGGVLDRVLFMMMNYDSETLGNLTHLTKVANKILKREIFEMRFMGGKPGTLLPTRVRYPAPYYEIFAELVQNSSNRYFKIDDDIVYIHRGTFRSMLDAKNSRCCLLHFANTVSNWRCNIKHQELGAYDSEIVNPKKLKFDFDPNGQCGWRSPKCAELTLRTFLHHYHRGQLHKYQFSGLELLQKRKRFSIHLFMLDKDTIDIKALQEAGQIGSDDEGWWTWTYSRKLKHPNCIVGGGLIVHFSYSTTYQEMLKLGLLKEFESVVQNEVGELIEKDIWRALGFPGR